jgi:integrase
MPRKLKDTELDTPAARGRLTPRRKPYWRRVTRTCHLGYRRNRTGGGSWVGRYYDGQRYAEVALGQADDALAADGKTVLTFDQAQEVARAWFAAQARKAAGIAGVEEVSPASYTVAQCLDDYLGWYAIHRKSVSRTQQAVRAHILPSLGRLEVAALTPRRIRQWHESIASAPARVRSPKGGPVRTRSAEATDPRQRKATANRLLTILKAALNRAFADGLVQSDEAWRRVKPFRSVDSPRVRYLSTAESIRLCNACDPEFRPLVQAALLTGCRYGELIALEVGDFNADAAAIRVRESKAGTSRHVYLNDEGVGFFADATAGRPSRDLLFPRSDGERWGRSHQIRRLAEAAREAALKEVSFHVLRHTYASQLAMRGVPLHVIAQQLGHADMRMTIRHYAHLAPSYVADAVRANLPALGISRVGRDSRRGEATLHVFGGSR